jgi:hypothetical protein
MEWGDTHELFIRIFIAMACAYVSGFDPAYDGTGITLNRSCSWHLLTYQGPRLANPDACTTVSATLFNDRLFLYQANSTNRAIPDAKPASSTFFKVNYHMASKIKFLTCAIRCNSMEFTIP